MKKQDAKKLESIKANGLKYFEQMKKAQASGQPIDSLMDSDAQAALTTFVNKASLVEDPSYVATSPAYKTETGPTNSPIVPTVTELGEGGRERGYDIYSLLMKRRVIMLEGEVNATMASIAVAQLLFLGSKEAGPGEAKKPITIHIDSPGGSVLAGLAIYDTMRSIQAPIHTVGIGMQASMGSILLAAGDTRSMTRSSKLMVHQISGQENGQDTDMEIGKAFSTVLHEDLKNIYVRHLGLTHEFWDIVLERNSWLSAEQALKMGFIDDIIVGDAKRTANEDYSIRPEFHQKREAQVPKTSNEIIMMINNGSAREGEAAKIRPELVTALSQFERFWTPARKAQTALKILAETDSTLAETVKPKIFALAKAMWKSGEEITTANLLKTARKGEKQLDAELKKRGAALGPAFSTAANDDNKTTPVPSEAPSVPAPKTGNNGGPTAQARKHA